MNRITLSLHYSFQIIEFMPMHWLDTRLLGSLQLLDVVSDPRNGRTIALHFKKAQTYQAIAEVYHAKNSTKIQQNCHGYIFGKIQW